MILGEYKKLVAEQDRLLQMSLYTGNAHNQVSFSLDESRIEGAKVVSEERSHFDKQKSQLEEERSTLTDALVQLSEDRLLLEVIGNVTCVILISNRKKNENLRETMPNGLLTVKMIQFVNIV